MTKKQVRNPRIFVDTPADLKEAYFLACRTLEVRPSEHLRLHMERTVRNLAMAPIFDALKEQGPPEQKEPA